MIGEDRRTRRSRQMLGEALISLLNEKGYKAITIREITERADLGYMTFYRHFESKDDLLVGQIQILLKDALAGFTDDCSEIGLALFQFVNQHHKLLRLVLVDESLTVVQSWIQSKVASNLLQTPNLFPDQAHPYITSEIAAMHISASVLNLIRWWLTNNRVESVEHMGKLYEQLILEPTLKALQPAR